ncbi:substrate-binding domain-containing protein [Actinoallomurus rhizosphaericola]|uniref:substrate-binding domain-containing protein n=1 Tax=Actinoallomurus rhizosphaericola TaxID=2952536 RepID=UPI00209248C3|nr:substrate-binding domain-containing protein [Actinoallomurus rhizosphaericola]MCO5997800.1 substrate-binding and VWA domain-containing protein [Actinoallomurus rhizosphaericola]
MPYSRRATGTKALGTLLVMLPALAACSLGSGPSRCDGRAITVAVAPSIAPAIEQAARRYDSGDACRVTITRQRPSDVAAALSGQGSEPGAPRPDAWIPDSSLWLPIARRTAAGAAAVRASGASVAMSPLVLAVPRGHAPTTATWRLLLSPRLPGTGGPPPALRVRFLDPAGDAAGLGALLLAQHAAGSGRSGLSTFAVTLYSDLGAALPDERAAYAQIASPSRPPTAVVLSEQSVWRHAHAGDAPPVAALYPGGGTIALDFPYVSTTTDRQRSQTVEDFQTTLAQSQTRVALQGLGLRTPDGVAGTGFDERYGVVARAPARLPAPDPVNAGRVLQMWQRTVLGARMLILLDVSPSMSDPVPGTRDTRMQATAKVATGGIKILSDNSQVALWEFSTGLDGARDYRRIVPYRTLSDKVGAGTQRDLLERSFGAAAPVPGSRTGLYDSVLAAYQEAVRTYQPDHNNVVVVLTDGMNYDPGRTISLQTLVKELARAGDPMRPVAIVPIAFGPDVDPGPLQRIAAATGGQAFVTLDPRQVQQVFLQMLIRLTCGETCPAS